MHASPRLRAISATSSPTYQGVHTMSPMHKSITALAAAALLATVGYATAQSTDQAADPNASMQPADPNASTQPAGVQAGDPGTTSTTTTTDTSTQVIPAPPVGVV